MSRNQEISRHLLLVLICCRVGFALSAGPCALTLRQSDGTVRCAECAPGFALSPLRRVCESCLAGCRSCQTTTSCDACHLGYRLQDGRCLACPGKGCQRCDPVLRCLECGPGYFTWGSKCFPCSTNCKNCKNGWDCEDCQEGFSKIAFLSSKDECRPTLQTQLRNYYRAFAALPMTVCCLLLLCLVIAAKYWNPQSESDVFGATVPKPASEDFEQLSKGLQEMAATEKKPDSFCTDEFHLDDYDY